MVWPHRARLVPSRYLSVFWDERRLGIRLRRARGLTVQWINIRETNCVIQWIEIYPAYSTIHLFSNWGLIDSLNFLSLLYVAEVVNSVLDWSLEIWFQF